MEQALTKIAQECRNVYQSASSGAREYFERGAATTKDVTGQVRDQARGGYIQTKRTVLHHPGQSVALAFAAGLLIGLLIAHRSSSE